jgi:hypothetical protein
MINCFIPNIGSLQFNPDDVPTFYQWSGYSPNVNEYKHYNFLEKEINGTNVLICSSDNGVGLCDYLSCYIINSDFLYETENILSPDYSYWFFRAWEQAEPYFEDQGWFKRIVQLFIDRQMIIRIAGEDVDFFCLIGFDRYETAKLPDELLSQIKEICEETRKEHKEDFGPFEILIHCRSEKEDAEIRWGFSYDLIELPDGPESEDLFDGTEGEAFREQYSEFESGIERAIQLLQMNPSLTKRQALFEVFGHFSFLYEVDGIEKDLDFGIDANNLMYSMLEDCI